MDLLQKHGHLKHDRERSSAQQLETAADHFESQQEVNSLLGSLGHPHNDHPDRRSSGAHNLHSDMKQLDKKLSTRDQELEQNMQQKS